MSWDDLALEQHVAALLDRHRRAGGTAGKFRFQPVAEANPHRDLHPPERHLTMDWRARQAAGPIAFRVDWLPFVNQEETLTEGLTRAWGERSAAIGTMTFPQQDPDSEDA